MTITELNEEVKWWHGPQWLNKVNEEWPRQPSYFEKISLNENNVKEIIREEKMIHFLERTNELIRGKWFKFKGKQEVFPLIESYGEWRNLLDVTATIFKAVDKFKNSKRNVKPSGVYKGPITKLGLLIPNKK